MKKKHIGSSLFILIILCATFFYKLSISDKDKINEDNKKVDTYSNNQVTAAYTNSPVNEKNYSIDDLRQVFIANDDFSKYEILECALQSDGTVPNLKGFVLYYDRETNNSCNIAFIGENFILNKVCFAVDENKGLKAFEIYNEQSLVYAGNGTVKVTVYKVENREIIDFFIGYAYDQSKASSVITVSSKKREN